MDELDALTEARDAWTHYTALMHRLIGCMVACWLAAVPLIIYAPIMLVVSAPATVLFGILAWRTHWDVRHGPYETKRDKWDVLVHDYRPMVPGPRERLTAAETAYRKAMQT